MSAPFLPSLPFELSYPLLFGVLLVAGMLGGELARWAHLPRMIGYSVVGFVFGPLMSALGLGPLVDEARIFVDLALGLVLFDLGRRMDIRWMRRDWTLAATSLAESFLTFALVFFTLESLDIRPIHAGLAAAIAMTTSPAVVLLTVHDTRAEGQVTERALNLTALNGLFASIIVTIMLGSAHYESAVALETAVLHPLYLLVGSLMLGAAMAWASRVIARAIEKDREVHFTLLAGLVIAAVGLSTLLKLPVVLALLCFGLFARNDERGYALLNVNLAPIGRLLYIVLFVITGASLPAEALVIGGAAGLTIVFARALGKIAGALMIAPLGGLTVRQSLGLGLVLMPMSSLTLLLQHDIARIYPAFGNQLSAAFVAAVIVMEIGGPLATYFGLRIAGDALPEPPETVMQRSRAA